MSRSQLEPHGNKCLESLPLQQEDHLFASSSPRGSFHEAELIINWRSVDQIRPATGFQNKQQ